MSSLLKLSTRHLRNIKQYSLMALRSYATKKLDEQSSSAKFETVFSFPTVRYMAIINKLKVYQLASVSLVVTSAGVLEMMDIVATDTFLAACYVGMRSYRILIKFKINTFSLKLSWNLIQNFLKLQKCTPITETNGKKTTSLHSSSSYQP